MAKIRTEALADGDFCPAFSTIFYGASGKLFVMWQLCRSQCVFFGLYTASTAPRNQYRSILLFMVLSYQRSAGLNGAMDVSSPRKLYFDRAADCSLGRYSFRLRRDCYRTHGIYSREVLPGIRFFCLLFVAFNSTIRCTKFT
jgi:hypothetical protein